jgi:mycoredoxin
VKKDIVVYGADWCGDTVRAKRALDDLGVQYTFIDIDQNAEGEKKVIAFNKGKRRIPLVEIGTESLSVPSASELRSKLG